MGEGGPAETGDKAELGGMQAVASGKVFEGFKLDVFGGNWNSCFSFWPVLAGPVAIGVQVVAETGASLQKGVRHGPRSPEEYCEEETMTRDSGITNGTSRCQCGPREDR